MIASIAARLIAAPVIIKACHCDKQVTIVYITKNKTLRHMDMFSIHMLDFKNIYY